MTIRDDARAAQRRMPDEFWMEMSGEQYFEEGYRQGALWTSEQADREPSAEAPTVTLAARSAGKTAALIEEILTKADDRGLRIEIVTPDREPTDAEVEAAARAMYRQTTQLSMSGARGLARAALIAAREVRDVS